MPNSLKRKALLIMRFADGKIFIFEPTEEHVPKRQYKEEAVGFFGRLLKPKPPKVQGFKEEAARKLREIAGFRDPDLIQATPEFSNGGTEWHPIVLRLDTYMLSEDFLFHLNNDAVNCLRRLEGHPFEVNIRKSLGLE